MSNGMEWATTRLQLACSGTPCIVWLLPQGNKHGLLAGDAHTTLTSAHCAQQRLP